MTLNVASTFAAWFTARSDEWIAAKEGRTFARLAGDIGCDPSMITNWRSGSMTPSPKTKLAAVAKLLAHGPLDAALCYELAGVDLGPVLQPSDAVA